MQAKTARAATTRRMLEAGSIVVVGASSRPGSFGARMASEVLRSPGSPRVHLVHPKYREVLGRPCVPSLSDLPEPVDLVLLGVPDSALVDQLSLAAERGDGGAVVFGAARGLGADLAAVAHAGGMALCGAGCMGFVNVARGVRAIGYVEPFPLQSGPIAFITHSGSVFSALLRTRRPFTYSVAVSAGQELVTSTADYLAYALDLGETRVVALFLETLRDADSLRAELDRARDRDIPVVALTVGGSPTGRAMVTAHSGALAGDDGAWEALFSAYGVHRVHDLDELADTVELFSIGRRISRSIGRSKAERGIATLHDSGGERVMVADAAASIGVPFAALGDRTRARLGLVLDQGLEPTNPLDVWGTGADTEALVTECMGVLADDDAVAAVALAVDLVEEYDADESYPKALVTMLGRTAKPLLALSNAAASLDQVQAQRLRAAGIPVLQGTHTGLRALRHLLDDSLELPPMPQVTVDVGRRLLWRARLSRGPLDTAATAALLRDYGIGVAQTLPAGSRAAAVNAADELGYPVVLKTDAAGIDHKADVGGVVVGLADAPSVAVAYDDLSDRLGGRVVIQPHIRGTVELALGIVDDPLLGPLVLLGVGGTLVEVIAQRRVALPPLSLARADAMLEGLPVVSTLLAGVRGRPAADRHTIVAALLALSQLATELGDLIEALDVNPLVCGPTGAVAVDAMVVLSDAPTSSPL